MTQTKLEKMTSDIEKTREKVTFYQNKLKVLTKQKEELENETIIAMFRSENLSEAEFAALLKSKKDIMEEIKSEK